MNSWDILKKETGRAPCCGPPQGQGHEVPDHPAVEVKVHAELMS